MKIIIIAAISQNNVIGKEGKIPWHSSAELKHFKATTMGNPIIMGRKTFESIGKALPGRLNIVITSRPEKFNETDDLLAFVSLDKALEYCREQNSPKVFIIGGASLYKEALKFADEMILTKMKFEVEGDTFFPDFKKAQWHLKSSEDQDEFIVEVYERKSK